MKLKIVLILLFSINGIICLKNGMSVDSLSAHPNYLVTIWNYDAPLSQFRCSGSIISPRFIITVGHCVHDVRNYEIYVVAGRFDLNDIQSVMVHNIHLHQNLKKISNSTQTQIEYWLNDIAILDLVLRLTWGLHIAPMPLTFERLIHTEFNQCYIMGWSYISKDMITLIVPQWANVITFEECSIRHSFLLPNEIYAVVTALSTAVDDTDVGSSLICNGIAVGMIVGARDEIRSVVSVLTFAPYQHFIEYITAGGVTPIRTDGFHYAVSIWEHDIFRCGGFMVHDRYVVTTAHCVNGLEITALSVVSANLAISSISSLSKWSLIESIEVHPQFYPIHNENWGKWSTENDIAILKLKSSLPWTSLFRSIILPDLSQFSADTQVEIIRWMPGSFRDTTANILGKSFVKIHNNDENAEGFHIGAEHFRIKGVYTLPIASTADIGNPIIYNLNVIGMVVAADLNAMGTADSVTCLKVLLYKDFIMNFINRTSSLQL